MDELGHKDFPDPIPLNLERRLTPDRMSARELVAVGDILPGTAAVIGEGYVGQVVRQRVLFQYEQDGAPKEYEDLLAVKHFKDTQRSDNLTPRQRAEREFNNYCAARDADLPVLPIYLIDKTKPIIAMYDYSEDGKFSVYSPVNLNIEGGKRALAESVSNLNDVCQTLLVCARKAADAGIAIKSSLALFRILNNAEKDVQLQFALADFGGLIHYTNVDSEGREHMYHKNVDTLAYELVGWIEDRVTKDAQGPLIQRVKEIMGTNV